MKTILLTIVAFALIMFLLALGLILGGKCIRLGCQANRAEPDKNKDNTLVCPRCERELSEKRRP